MIEGEIDMYKNIGIFLLGAAIGSLITYKLIVVNYEEVEEPLTINVSSPSRSAVDVNQLAEELAYYHKKKTQEMVKSVLEDSEGGYTAATPGEEIDLTDKESMHPDIIQEETEFVSTDMDLIKEKEIRARIEYSKQVHNYVNGEGERDTVEFKSEPKKKIETDAYVIDINEFSDGEEMFDKLTVYYYEFDNVLVDADEEVIVEIDDTIGWDSLDCFGEGSVNPDIVYVRNEELKIDYEIIRLRESYGKSVLGYDED